MTRTFLTCARIIALLLGPVMAIGAAEPPAVAAQTFCNPLNLDYGPFANGGRHAADPVIVLFKDQYYLFDTLDKPGYRVSDDLLHWRTILFDADSWNLAGRPNGKGAGGITAPAVIVYGDAIYFMGAGNPHVIKTTDPLSGHWEPVSTGGPKGDGDPNFFLDDDGRLYETRGLGENEGVELNPRDFQPLTPRYTLLAPMIKAADIPTTPYGLHRGRKEIEEASMQAANFLDTSSVLDNLKTFPVIEGSWLTKHAGRYYLQDSSPGTTGPWYSDATYVADKPLGPYQLTDYSPVSLKVGGFINSAGHSCVFADRYGNLWRVTTMWVGSTDRFERRLGLFPTGFDAAGRLFTRTDFGDYPLLLPTSQRDPEKDPVRPDWSVLSTGKTCTASTTLDAAHGPEKAADEMVRTWWSAQTGDAGEWFQMNLGKVCDVRAVQLNFAEQDARNAPASEDYHAYRLLVSADGKTWETALDRSSNKTAVPHDYAAFEPPRRTRYLKVENIHAAKGGKFSLRDLRVFGHGGGHPPAAPMGLTVTRLADPRNVTFAWQPVAGADGYLISYGVAPDALHVPLQVQGGRVDELTVSCLNRDVKYYYRIDAYNDSGVTAGPVSGTAK